MAHYSYPEALEAIPDLIESISVGMEHTFVAIDGMSGTGKSTFADALAARCDAFVIRMDDFYLPKAERTPERTSQPGWNVDYDRFTEEIARPFLRGELPIYRRFDCHTQSLSDGTVVPDRRVYLIEGCYAMHPAIPDFYDLRICMTAEEETREQRILARDGEAMLERFRHEWFPLEEEYLTFTMAEELADVVVGERSGGDEEPLFRGFETDLPLK